MSLFVDVRARIGTFDLEVRFEAPPGITALFGPSGAGKSLTLRCIAGLSRPQGGRIVLGDRVLLDRKAGIDVPARERRMGYLFQHHALFPHLDVAGNVGYGLKGRPGAWKRERVRELLALVGLTGFETRRPAGLSGGEQQRVALARALAPEPRFLLLDEPFSALDMEIRLHLLEELRALHRRTGVPLLLVSHDMDEVRRMAHWLVRFRDGRVEETGPIGADADAPG